MGHCCYPMNWGLPWISVVGKEVGISAIQATVWTCSPQNVGMKRFVFFWHLMLVQWKRINLGAHENKYVWCKRQLGGTEMQGHSCLRVRAEHLLLGKGCSAPMARWAAGDAQQASRAESWLSILCIAQFLPPSLPELFQKEWFQVTPVRSSSISPSCPWGFVSQWRAPITWVGDRAQCGAVCAAGPLWQCSQSTHSPGECPIQLWGRWGWYLVTSPWLPATEAYDLLFSIWICF